MRCRSDAASVASIAAHGLLQSLSVRPMSDGEGPRPASASLWKLSLVETVVRENLHPADQFGAFKRLADEASPIQCGFPSGWVNIPRNFTQ